jgi:hypothetical protein
MNRRNFLKKISILAPTIFIPKIVVTVWKNIKLSPSTLKSFDKIIFTVIRDFSDMSLIQELVTIQPMSSPSGKIFYLDFINTKKI